MSKEIYVISLFISARAKEDAMSVLDNYHFDPRYAGYLGGEEEAWLCNPSTGILVPGARLIFCARGNLRGRFRKRLGVPHGRVVPELPLHQVEWTTGICENPLDFEADLSKVRSGMASIAEDVGLAIAMDPIPPSAHSVQVFPKKRYKAIAQAIPEHVLRNGWISGFHVHVGCRHMADAVHLMHALGADLPMFVSLSARSPGPGGTASQRMLRYLEMQPDIVPPDFSTGDCLVTFASVATQQGFATDPGRCWWGVRVNAIGTVEMRIMDVQATARHAAELAALVQMRARMAQAGLFPMGTNKEDIAAAIVEAARMPSLRASYQRPVEETRLFAQRQGSPQHVNYLTSLMQRLF